MLESLTFKQKVILGSILICMVLVIGIYGYTKINAEEKEIITSSEEFIVSSESNNQIENELKNELVEEKMVIHITGQVKENGILELELGSRIADAISAAGGATEEADLNKINLAYELQDGQKIYIPSKNEKNNEITYVTSESGENVIIEGNTNGTTGEININQAGEEELQQLPGIGPSLAAQIIQYRNEKGKFSSIEDLQNVKGIGDAKYNNIKNYVTVK